MTIPFVISDAQANQAPAVEALQPAAGATEVPEGSPYELSAEKMMMDNLLILGMLFFIFYFILIRPQQKRVRMHQEMMKALQKGDKVITNGGLIGTISKFEGDDVIVLEISPNVKVRVARGSISEISSDKADGAIANDN
jgi:preprotein translocase YajC subunit